MEINHNYIESLTNKLNECEDNVKKLEESNKDLYIVNYELNLKIKNMEKKHDSELKSLLENIDELLSKSKSEADNLLSENEILKKRLASQKRFVEELQQEKQNM
jgi:hypothetical protein